MLLHADPLYESLRLSDRDRSRRAAQRYAFTQALRDRHQRARHKKTSIGQRSSLRRTA